MSVSALFRETRDEARSKSWQALVATLKPEAKGKKRTRKNEPSLTGASIEVVEVIDLTVLKKIYERRQELLPDVPSYQTLFRNFYDNTVAANGRRVVCYQQKAHGEDFGRYSSRNGASLQGLKHELRATLAHELYHQLDIGSAHPTILRSLAADHGWETPCLDHYVANRENVLAMFPAGRERAKTTMLMLMFGGDPNENLPFFVDEFRQELVKLARKIRVAFADTAKRLRLEESGADERKQVYSFLSRVLQDREAQCLVSAVHFMRSRGWEPGALLHDGLLVLKRPGHEIDAALLGELSREIEAKCSIRGIEFKLKEFGARFDLQ